MAATKIFLSDIDLNNNQLKNTRLQNAASSSELNVYIPNKTNDPQNNATLKRAFNDLEKDKDLGLLYWNTTYKTAYFLSGYTYPTTETGDIETGIPIPIWKSLEGSGSGVLTSDFWVDLKGTQKWFGKYQGGTPQKIADAGTSIETMLRNVAMESSAPVTSISLKSTDIPFNPTSVSNIVTYNAISLDNGVTIDSITLQYKRGDDSWTTIGTSSGAKHTISLEALSSDRTSSFSYQIIAIDSNGRSTTSATVTAFIKSLTAPTTSTIVNPGIREIGYINIVSNTLITKNTPNISFYSYQIYVVLNDSSTVSTLVNSSPILITGDPTTFNININMDKDSASINGTLITDIKDATNIKIYTKIIERYTNSAGVVKDVVTNLLLSNSSYELMKFIGAGSIDITNYKVSPMNTLAGTTVTYEFSPYPNRFHVIAIPFGKALTSVKTFPNNETLTSNFILTTEVEIPDGGSTFRKYNVYKYTPDTSFSSDIILKIIMQ